MEKLFHYPELKIKLVKKVERPLSEFIARTYTELEFSPDQTILKEMNIDLVYLNEYLAILFRLAPEEVELNLADLKPGSWQAINSAIENTQGAIDQQSFGSIRQVKLSENTARLADIATVYHINDLTKPQGEEGKLYQLDRLANIDTSYVPNGVFEGP